ncbi:FAS1 domain-containing protein [Xylaria castorea]|nr:FAS1 domain-containing protein [Xylaria castorea]
MQFRSLLIPILVSPITAQYASSLTDALGSQNSSLSSLNALLQQNPQFLQTIGNASNVTFLAPNNDAIDALMNNNNSNSSFPVTSPGDLQALLSYHVLNGTYYPSNISNPQFIPTHLTNASYTNETDGQRVECMSNDNNVTFISALKQNISAVTNNINFTGGTIYVVNGILSIPQNLTDTLTNANLTACVGAIAAANQTQTLNSLGNATIFAPNNEAFYAIGSILGNLTTDQLSGILGYHVVNGTVAYSPDLGNGTTLRTEDGQDLNIRVVDNQTYVNSARVTVPDILYANGVVHVIDQVLNPNDTSAAPHTSGTSAGPPAYTGASSGTVPFTSGVTTPTTTYPAATSAGGESRSRGAAVPVKTGAIGPAALFGGAALLVNL